ncbi:DNA alkylation repair protein [Lactobacillus paragasseri]|uniref:DNA alkylation repair protein n=1 Tax=Lactobacillus paragasseri TaxID=2107999 RepID=A0ABD4ZYS0_9LACO|nr:DNA alkylation repair protein [Lactobacillus paragasseri]MDK7952029.1 DNA alkylation repair protein [Lactobacillus paragasseri]MDO6360684.1 DNA alkylation repair protein [Lactobacillus paragasseri]MDX5059300.1 DNA alkylation repair protein [Lactobacillus paragasseri]
MKEISKYQRLRKKLIENSDPELARQMESYMRNKFKFYGLKTPERRKSYHDLIKLEKANKKIDWKFLDQAWADEHREAQYFVCDYLIALEKYLKFEDIDHIFNYVKSKQWWDTIDSLIKPIGNIGLRDDRVTDLMLAWSKDDDFWVRRVAIEHQLLRKDKMNVELLNAILENNLGSSEFFINKAIGWALRDYSKTNPNWVENFIRKHQAEMATLSIKEGRKYLS